MSGRQPRGGSWRLFAPTAPDSVIDQHDNRSDRHDDLCPRDDNNAANHHDNQAFDHDNAANYHHCSDDDYRPDHDNGGVDDDSDNRDPRDHVAFAAARARTQGAAILSPRGVSALLRPLRAR